MSQRTLGDQKAQFKIDEVKRAREIGERLDEWTPEDQKICDETLNKLCDWCRCAPGEKHAYNCPMNGTQGMHHALQSLADALKQMLAVFPPEFDEKWVESSGEKIQVQAWNQARAALDAAKLFLKEES